MTYASQADMVARFGEGEVIALTDRANAGVIDAAVLAAALVQADAEINPYLQPKYLLPLQVVPTAIVGLACDIARYRLCSAAVTVTQDIRDRYKDAVKFLDAVSRGHISLGIDASSRPAAPSDTVKFAPGNGRVFDRANR